MGTLSSSEKSRIRQLNAQIDLLSRKTETEAPTGGLLRQFIGLTDSPLSYLGSEDLFVKVNSDGTALVFKPYSPSWGSITGSLTNQTDLQAALDTKVGEAPNDGIGYVRKDEAWAVGSAGVTTEVPLTPANTAFTITHGLGKYPSVTVADTAGSEVEVAVSYTDDNALTVSCNAAFSGTAYLN